MALSVGRCVWTYDRRGFILLGRAGHHILETAMRLRVVIGIQDPKGHTLTVSAICETDPDEYIDRRETLIALGDQARGQFRTMQGHEEDSL